MLIDLNFLVLVLALVLVLNMSIIQTLGIGLELFPISRLVLVLVSTEMKNQDPSWYWSQKKFHLKTCLGIGLEIKLISRQVLVLVLNKKGGLAELWCVCVCMLCVSYYCMLACVAISPKIKRM